MAAEIEAGLTASGLAHTLLRSNAYMQNVLALAPAIAATTASVLQQARAESAWSTPATSARPPPRLRLRPPRTPARPTGSPARN